MKRNLKIMGLFLLLLLGNTVIATPQLKEVVEGDEVTFYLVGIFTYGIDKGEKVVEVSVQDPFLGYRKLTNIRAYVLLNVQPEQQGIYIFTATWSDGMKEDRVAYLVVHPSCDYCYTNSKMVFPLISVMNNQFAILPGKNDITVC